MFGGVEALASPARATYWFVPGHILFLIIPVLGLACFAWLLSRRLSPLLRGAPDPRFDRLCLRFGRVVKFWLGQWRQPRYPVAGILHIVIFAGFLVLMARSASLVMLGISDLFSSPAGRAWELYNVIKDYAATFVFLAVAIAAIRRLVFKPARYEVPRAFGRSHTAEAILVLALIAALMLSESIFEASAAAFRAQHRMAAYLPPLTLAWLFDKGLMSAPPASLRQLHLSAYLIHDVTFFAFLCYLPLGKHFHVITSLLNVFFAKLDREDLKPVRWDVGDGDLDQVKAFGVKRFEDFTWKHILDFYSCADCGRCSDQCPANTVGRPLSPRFLSIKARDYAFHASPVIGRRSNGQALVGNIYSADEIWSCTTCGACEQECPLLAEHVDKIVDLRRGLVDDCNVPQSLQKPLHALASRGNPYGKPEKKRGDWTRAADLCSTCTIKLLDGKQSAETLYFVDSTTAYDSRMQSIAGATARLLNRIGEEFGILGAAERDSGHDARRFGEETLFLVLRDHNARAIAACGARRIVTADPHAYHGLKHDYRELPPVEHMAQVMAAAVASGKLKFTRAGADGRVYTYHDPCYLGRHNQIYDEPRYVLDAIPGLRRVEMRRTRDRSFCCGGGGLMLFYEARENERMGVARVRMAAEAGANTIVTACPFCLANIEDAIKVAGMEGKMTAIDLMELAESHIAAPVNELRR